MNFKERLSFALMPYPVWMWYLLTISVMSMPWMVWWWVTHAPVPQTTIASDASPAGTITHADVSVIATILVEAARDTGSRIERIAPTVGSAPGSAMLELVATGSLEGILQLVRMAGAVDELRIHALHIIRHDESSQSVRMTLQLMHGM